MGVGSRRVMGIGLPLLQLLSVSQFEAVLAHEFGHFHGGDTHIGPWIYRTRAGIGRTLSTLQRMSDSKNWAAL
jgi:heat shock protein HtpX